MPEQNQQPLLPVVIEPIVAKIKEYVPKFESIVTQAEERLKLRLDALETFLPTWDGAPNETLDELLKAAISTMGASKEAYEFIMPKRMEITGPLDDYKSQLMAYEKIVATDGKQDNIPTKIRLKINTIENKKLEYKRQQEEIARKKTERENYKVDLVTQMRKNLATMLIDFVKKTGDGFVTFWGKATLENFAANETKFMAWKGQLPKDVYNKAFEVPFDIQKISPEEIIGLTQTTQKEETYEKWAALLSEAIDPIINEWRAKIPQIKANLEAVKNAADDAERKRIADAQFEQTKKEADERQKNLEMLAEQTNRQLDDEAVVDKQQNIFVEQLATQDLATGPTKKVYVLEDPKKLIKSLAYAMSIVLTHEKFPGFYALDKKKQPKIDTDTGKPLLNEHIAYFIDFCADYNPVKLEGFELVDKAKTIIRQ